MGKDEMMTNNYLIMERRIRASQLMARGLSEYLHRYKCKESPSCICDPEVNETATHIIAVSCRRLGTYGVEYRLNCDITLENMKSIKAGKCRKIFLSFCIKIL